MNGFTLITFICLLYISKSLVDIINSGSMSSGQVRGCPVCRDQKFDGSSHRCTKCQKYVHPWCGVGDEDGSGEPIVCNNCN